MESDGTGEKSKETGSVGFGQANPRNIYALGFVYSSVSHNYRIKTRQANWLASSVTLSVSAVEVQAAALCEKVGVRWWWCG